MRIFNFTCFNACQHAERAMCYRPSVHPSICPSVRPSYGWISQRQSKTVEVRIMQFSPYSSPIGLPLGLVFEGKGFIGSPERGVKPGWVGKQAIF